MDNIIENASLRPYNTFGIDVRARWLAEFAAKEELEELVEWGRERHRLVLGGGSNILLTGDVDGLVLRNRIGRIDLIDEDEDYV